MCTIHLKSYIQSFYASRTRSHNYLATSIGSVPVPTPTPNSHTTVSIAHSSGVNNISCSSANISNRLVRLPPAKISVTRQSLIARSKEEKVGNSSSTTTHHSDSDTSQTGTSQTEGYNHDARDSRSYIFKDNK